jgi:hypothetical protein
MPLSQRFPIPAPSPAQGITGAGEDIVVIGPCTEVLPITE